MRSPPVWDWERIAMGKDKPSPSDDRAERDADLARREKALTEELDALEARVKPKKPNPPPIGGMF
jgi:hypothetical protein